MPVQTSRTIRTVNHTMAITAEEFRETFGIPKLADICLKTPATPGSYSAESSVSNISTFKITWTETIHES